MKIQSRCSKNKKEGQRVEEEKEKKRLVFVFFFGGGGVGSCVLMSSLQVVNSIR